MTNWGTLGNPSYLKIARLHEIRSAVMQLGLNSEILTPFYVTLKIKSLYIKCT